MPVLTLRPFEFATTVREGHGLTTPIRCVTSFKFPYTNRTNRSHFVTQSCCPAASTQLRRIGKYLWNKTFKWSSYLFGGRPLLRTGCCGKLSCQFWKRHCMISGFGQRDDPATSVVNANGWCANRCFQLSTPWQCRAGRARSFIRIIVPFQSSSCKRTPPTKDRIIRRCVSSSWFRSGDQTEQHSRGM
jgi:hypothetical protein